MGQYQGSLCLLLSSFTQRSSASPFSLYPFYLVFPFTPFSFPSLLSFLPSFPPPSLPSFLLSIHPIHHTHLTPRPSLLPTPSFLHPHAISSIVMHLKKSIARQLLVKLAFSTTLFQLQVQLQLHVNWNMIIIINKAKLLSHPSTRTHTYTYTYT